MVKKNRELCNIKNIFIFAAKSEQFFFIICLLTYNYFYYEQNRIYWSSCEKC